MSVAALARMVKFSHSLFALPFVASAVVLASAEARLEPRTLALVAIAVVAARTAAMAMNRISDRAFDARNPRTARRELVTGEVSPAAAWALLLASAASFTAAAALIAPICGALALPVLAILLGYSYAKRFTWACHLWLGVAQALAPVGVAIALTGVAPLSAAVLGLGVGAWIAGFDVLYSLQDREFDAGQGLHSIPARFGVVGSLWISGALHTGVLVALGALPTVYAAEGGPALGWGYAVGWIGCVALLAYQHWIVRPSDLSRLGAAFFQSNGLLSVWLFAATAVDLL
jgi:4-hydroxybenzoate polyprenyltransferase